VHSGAQLYLESDDVMNLKSAKDFKATTDKKMHLKSSKEMFLTGKTIDLNGPPAEDADPSEEKEAFWTNRIPQHEPWGRIMMTNTDNDSGNSHTLELSYDDANVGKKELTDTISRGPFWRR